MSNATRNLLFLTIAAACFTGNATAQGRPGNSVAPARHNRMQAGLQTKHIARHCSRYPVRHGFTDHSYHRPIFVGYRSQSWYRGYNGHEVADMVRSRSQANLVNAHARTQNETARSARMDNSVKALHTYIARRSINSEMRFGHLHAQGEYAHAAKAEAQLVAKQAGVELGDEPRLTADEISDMTGRLKWPLLLQMEHFNQARKPVNQIFATRARTGQINSDHYLPLCDWIEKVSEELTKNVANYPQADYAEAQGFLQRLLVEARLPAAGTGLQLAGK